MDYYCLMLVKQANAQPQLLYPAIASFMRKHARHQSLKIVLERIEQQHYGRVIGRTVNAQEFKETLQSLYYFEHLKAMELLTDLFKTWDHDTNFDTYLGLTYYFSLHNRKELEKAYHQRRHEVVMRLADHATQIANALGKWITGEIDTPDKDILNMMMAFTIAGGKHTQHTTFFDLTQYGNWEQPHILHGYDWYLQLACAADEDYYLITV